jgi:RHS repeat-associated protein
MPYYLHSDRLGSATAVTNQNGNAEQILCFQPWGEDFLDLSNGFQTDYRFGGKIRDAESDMMYFEDRYRKYDGFRTTDQMWYKKPWQSSYLFCSNDPINRVDPTGMTDFEIDNKGYIYRKAEGFWKSIKTFFTGDKTTEDYLYVKGSNTKMKFEKGILDQIKPKSVTINKGKQNEQTIEGHMLSIDNAVTANEMYNFVRDNTDVEWSFITYNDNKNNILSTSHKNGEEYTQNALLSEILNLGFNLQKASHSHNYDHSYDKTNASSMVRSDFPSVPDIMNKEEHIKNYPTLTLFTNWEIYDCRTKKTIHY